MKLKKNIPLFLIIIFAFMGGAIINSLMVSDSVPLNGAVSSLMNTNVIKQVLGESLQKGFITEVEYYNGQFFPNAVKIRKGNYIHVKNTNQTEQMWLDSNNPDFNTVRAYGEGETIKVVADDLGEFEIKNKLNTQSILSVSVVSE